MIATLLTCLAVALGLAVATWVVTRLRDDASIVDILWGMFFVAMTLTAALAGDLGSGGRKTLLVVLVTLWGVRLSGYLAFVVALPLLLALGSSSSQPVGLVAVAGVAL